MNIQFGSGVLYGKPVAGNEPTNPTPFKFGVLQECEIGFKGDLKKLYGQYQLPVATARGKIDCTVKGKLAVYDVSMINQLYFAQTSTVGYDLIVDGELGTITGAAVTVAHNPLVDDWGVLNSVTGQQFISMPNAAAVTASGEYFANTSTGVYTFNAADNGVVVKISYSYNTNAAGATIPLTNQLMGYAPELKMLLYNRFRNKYLAIQLNDVTLGTISFPSKLEDFWISDFDGSANADASNSLGKLMMDLF